MSSPRDRTSPRGRGAGGSPGPSTSKKSGKKGQPSPRGGPSLQEVKKRGYHMRKTPERQICDQLDRLHLGTESPAAGTGLVYDDRMTQFFCLWDDKFPECPARLVAIKEKLVEYGLLERCVSVPAREASEEELLLVHSSDYVELMKSTQNMTEEELRALSDKYDSVYLHPMSFSGSRVAAGSVLQLVDRVVSGEIRNGLAVVRPPGHHAHTDQMNGYCMFNHLAIAARYAQRQHGVKRVLIVDWDVHHGQGTQFIFEDDPSVLYFSVHRYENGEFWPHLAESSSAAAGKERGEQYNINVPWNKTGMSDADYITAFLHLLLPVSYEFQPQLVLVAAGYDSVVGDPKGEMSATPACFSHLTHMLMCMAEGRLLLALEGGYNPRSLAEGACASLKVLLGDPCPLLPPPFAPCESALDSISGAISVHRRYWRCLQDQGLTLKLETGNKVITEENSGSLGEEDLTVTLDAAMREVMRTLPASRTGLVYDERMMEHYNMWDSGHPELPQRIARIFQRHKEMGLLDRCTRLPHRTATTEELQMCHSLPYIQKMQESARMKPRDLHRTGSEYNSIYINSRSHHSACLAAGCTFSVVEAVVKGQVQNGVGIVRPPGHHAEPGAACGFCFFNNVALAARYAQSLQSAAEPPLRVMILDWDVHHGNGTQHIFQEDPSVLYVSLHRYDDGLFFPCSEDAAHDKVGSGPGEGYNVNIPWNGGKMGDVEYLLAFHRIVMPVAYEFSPHLVLVSAGFDAARGDPLGGCRVSPEGYAHMTHLLMGLAGGKVVLVLEGGYNLTSISESMSMCTRTLLGDPPPTISDLHAPRPAAIRAISSVLEVQQKYWRSLRIHAGPPESEVLQPRNDGEPGLSSPQSGSPGKQVVSTPPPPKPGLEDLSQGLSPSMARDDFPRTDAIQDAERDLVALMKEGSISSLAPQERQIEEETILEDKDMDAGLKEAASYVEDKDMDAGPKEEASYVEDKDMDAGPKEEASYMEDKDMDAGPKEDASYMEDKDMDAGLDQSYEGEALEVVIELKLSEKTPEEQRSSSGGSVEELLRDLHLGDVRSPDGDSKPVGGARKKTSMGRQSGGAQSADTQPPADSAEGDRFRSYAADPDPSLGFSGELFSVTPLPWCPHLEQVRAVPPRGVDVTAPCAECRTRLENWVCLTCYQVLCGRYVAQHMLIHGVSCGHNVVLSFSDFSVWCYSCDSYIHNEVLIPAKQSAYRHKFGEDMPGA
ncbi:protein deacetylase HDAC6 [Anomaloglossus baeobatrachus]|uniref:protein deacetylase HDAC6 n=1 Tax=Anomaloglossus baeobatrachus TaxID=238106 RepID=UPI003F4F9104